MPLANRPGDLADSFEVLVDVDGIRRRAWLFQLRLMDSGRDFAWSDDRQDNALGGPRPGGARVQVRGGHSSPDLEIVGFQLAGPRVCGVG